MSAPRVGDLITWHYQETDLSDRPTGPETIAEGVIDKLYIFDGRLFATVYLTKDAIEYLRLGSPCRVELPVERITEIFREAGLL